MNDGLSYLCDTFKLTVNDAKNLSLQDFPISISNMRKMTLIHWEPSSWVSSLKKLWQPVNTDYKVWAPC